MPPWVLRTTSSINRLYVIPVQIWFTGFSKQFHLHIESTSYIEHLPMLASYIWDLVPKHSARNPAGASGKQKYLSKQFLNSQQNRQGLERAKTSSMCTRWKLIQLPKCRSAVFINCSPLTPRVYFWYYYLSKIAYLFMCNFNKNFYDEVNSLWCILVHLH